jgi:acid stress-induced BolA-like protein IbaG/YrbA
MSEQPLTQRIRHLIETAIPGAKADVAGGDGGHFRIAVTAAAFAGKSLLEKQRLVYSAIAEMMRGDNAPIHAVDQLTTSLPD